MNVSSEKNLSPPIDFDTLMLLILAPYEAPRPWPKAFDLTRAMRLLDAGCFEVDPQTRPGTSQTRFRCTEAGRDLIAEYALAGWLGPTAKRCYRRLGQSLIPPELLEEITRVRRG